MERDICDVFGLAPNLSLIWIVFISDGDDQYVVIELIVKIINTIDVWRDIRN